MNYVISVFAPQKEEQMIQIFRECGAKVACAFHGRGTAVRSMLDILGIEESEKRVLFAVCDKQNTEKIIALQKERLFLGIPGHGMTAAIPVKSVGGGKTLAYFNDGKNKPKTKPPQGFTHELIVVIVNEGMTDTVMNAARRVGAAGGTVIHGKGTGDGAAERFLNVSIAAEKEVIFIVARAERKTDIMKAVLDDAGPATEAGGVVFSLPVSDAAGFGLA